MSTRKARAESDRSGDDDAEQQALATQRAAFNYEAAEQTELEREREVLEDMVQAQLKFEDEIVKKWIAMI